MPNQDKRFIHKRIQALIYDSPEIRQTEGLGEPIQDWSPNNLRKVIISPEGVVVQWFTISGTSANRKTQIATFNDKGKKEYNDFLYAVISSPQNYLKILSQYHKFSNLEEVVILPQSTLPALSDFSFDVKSIIQSLKVVDFPRLASIIIGVEPISLQDFLSEYTSTFNSSNQLLKDVVPPNLFSVKVFNEQYYNAIALRGFYYLIDSTSLSKTLTNIRDTKLKEIDTQLKTGVNQVSLTEIQSLIDNNNLLVPLIEKLLQFCVFFSKNKQFNIKLRLPTEQAYFGKGSIRPQGYKFLEKANLVDNDIPKSNLTFFKGLYQGVWTNFEILFTQANITYDQIKEIKNLQATDLSVMEYNINTIERYLIPLFDKSGITYPTLDINIDLMTLDDFNQLQVNVANIIKEQPQEALKIWNLFYIYSKTLTPLMIVNPDELLDIYLTKLSRTLQEYVGYNLQLNLTDNNLYYSTEVIGYKFLSLDAIPSKHYIVTPKSSDTIFDGQFSELWVSRGLNVATVKSLLKNLTSTNYDTSLKVFIDVIHYLQSISEGILVYLRDKHNLQDSVIATNYLSTSGISLDTTKIVNTYSNLTNESQVTYDNLIRVLALLLLEEV